MRRRTQVSVPSFSRSTRSGGNPGNEPGDRALRSITTATGISSTGGRGSGGGVMARSETGSRSGGRRGNLQRGQRDEQVDIYLCNGPVRCVCVVSESHVPFG